MLALPYYNSIKTEHYDENTPKDLVRRVEIILLTALILDILLLIFAIRAIFKCRWSAPISILLIFSLFIPYVGFIMAISLIIYAQISCK